MPLPGGAVVGVGDEQLERVGRAELAAEGPRPWAAKGETREPAVKQPARSRRRSFRSGRCRSVADQCGADRVEQHVVGLRPCGQGHCRAGQGLELAPGESVNPVKFGPTAPELATYTESPCTAMLTGVGPSEETTPPGTSWRLPSQPHPQYRDLVAARIYGEQVAAVAAELERSLGGQPRTGPGPAGREGRPRHGCEGPVGVAVKRPDRVGPRGVVVEVDVPDHRREALGGALPATPPALAVPAAEGARAYRHWRAWRRRAQGAPAPMVCFRIVFVTSMGPEGEEVCPTPT